MPPFVKFLKEWWPVLAGFVALVLAYGEMRWQIKELMKADDKFMALNDADNKLGSDIALIRDILGAHASSIVGQGTQIEGMRTHMTPSAIQKWGQIQADVERHEREINDLEDDLRDLR